MSKYEKDMVGNKPISTKGVKKPTSSNGSSAPAVPYDASRKSIFKKGGSVKKKMAMGGAAKVRLGMAKD